VSLQLALSNANHLSINDLNYIIESLAVVMCLYVWPTVHVCTYVCVYMRVSVYIYIYILYVDFYVYFFCCTIMYDIHNK